MTEHNPNKRAGLLRDALSGILQNSACRWAVQAARKALHDDDALREKENPQPVAGARCPRCRCLVENHCVGPNDDPPLHCWGDGGDGNSCNVIPACALTQLEIKNP